MENMKDWELLSVKQQNLGGWLPIEERTYKKNDGKVVDDFSVVTVANVSMVIPVLENGRIVMVKQFKPGAGELTLEFPAGRLKPDQNYEEAARMEMMEETGMEVGELIEVGETVTFPTKGSERVMGYVGRDVRKTETQCLDEHEEIEVVDFSRDEISQMVIDGRINTAPSITVWHLANAKELL